MNIVNMTILTKCNVQILGYSNQNFHDIILVHKKKY